MENYFVITNSDENTNIECLDKDELLKRINENYWGDADYFTSIPRETDTNYWSNNVMIIKGEIITPIAEKIVTRYNII